MQIPLKLQFKSSFDNFYRFVVLKSDAYLSTKFSCTCLTFFIIKRMLVQETQRLLYFTQLSFFSHYDGHRKFSLPSRPGKAARIKPTWEKFTLSIL